MGNLPCRGLNRSLPKVVDLCKHCQRVQRVGIEPMGSALLEGDAILENHIKSRLPDQCHIAGVGGLKSP
jgi:hypothetical protein